MDRLLEKEYITRCTSPTDGRCRLLQLTQTGQVMVESLRTALTTTDQAVLADLTEEEQINLENYLRRIITRLENEVNQP